MRSRSSSSIECIERTLGPLDRLIDNRSSASCRPRPFWGREHSKVSNRIEWAETPAFNPMSIDRPRRAGTPPQAPNIGTGPCVRRAVRRRQAEQAAFAAIGSFWAASGAWAGFRRGRSATRSRNSTCSHTPKRRRWRCTRFGRSIACFLLLVCLYLDKSDPGQPLFLVIVIVIYNP